MSQVLLCSPRDSFQQGVLALCKRTDARKVWEEGSEVAWHSLDDEEVPAHGVPIEPTKLIGIPSTLESNTNL